jgi:hypothetical protein
MRVHRIHPLSQDHDLGRLPMVSSALFTNDLDQHPLPPPPVKTHGPAIQLTQDPLPGAKVQTTIGHRDHNLAAHDLALQMRVCIVFAGVIVPVLPCGCMGGQTLQPLLIILVQAILVVVDEHTRRNVLRIYKGQSPLYRMPLSYH